MGQYSIRGVEKKVQSLQHQLHQWVNHTPADRPVQFLSLQKNISAIEFQINQELTLKKIKISDFTIHSQKMIGWVRFLSDPTNLQTHLETMCDLQNRIDQHAPRGTAGTRVQLYNTSTLYRVTAVANKRLAVIHQGYCGAPSDILEILTMELCGKKIPAGRKKLQEYARSERFLQICNQSHAAPKVTKNLTRGSIHDLAALFEKINQSYFAGDMDKPAIAWSPRKTKHRFGSYNFEKDQILISKTLDQKNVPSFVVEFVLYHEMLHRKLGFRQTEHRKIAHTAEFRLQEHQFAQYTEAQKMINHLAAPVRRKKPSQ